MFWSAIEIKTKLIIQIQACKFLQIQTLETKIISLFVSESGTLTGPNLNSDVQVGTDIQRGVVELYYDTLKAMDVDSDSDSDADSIWYDRRVSRNKIISRSFPCSFHFIYYI